MTILQAIILGVVQGVTEFIPVSSSGHLILVPWLLGWSVPDIPFDVAAHVGTLVAVLIFFRQEWFNMTREGVRWIAGTRPSSGDARLVFLLVVGTLPAALISGLAHDAMDAFTSNPLVSALLLVATALILLIGERIGREQRTLDSLEWRDALVVGIAQAIAILPGISRSGITISAGRARGLGRADAARFSFLLSTPIIAGVGIIQAYQLWYSRADLLHVEVLLAGATSAFVSGLLVVSWLLRYLRNRSTTVFVIYCLCFSLINITIFIIRGS